MLVLASEECAEVIEAAAKAQRHGLLGSHPNGGPHNIDRVARELGQVAAVVEMMIQLGIIDRVEYEAGIEEKWEKVGDYLHHVAISEDGRGERRAMTLRQWRRRWVGKVAARSLKARPRPGSGPTSTRKSKKTRRSR